MCLKLLGPNRFLTTAVCLGDRNLLLAAAPCDLPFLLAEKTEHFVPHHGPKPVAESTDLSLVFERANRLGHSCKNSLRHIFRILMFKSAPPAVGIHQGPIHLHERPP